MAEAELVIVFEATNDSLRELYIGLTTFPLQQLQREHSKVPPRSIAHWKKEHAVNYRVVEEAIRRADANAFLDSYGQSTIRMGWKVIRDA
jgi:hypothetical protein